MWSLRTCVIPSASPALTWATYWLTTHHSSSKQTPDNSTVREAPGTFLSFSHFSPLPSSFTNWAPEAVCVDFGPVWHQKLSHLSQMLLKPKLPHLFTTSAAVIKPQLHLCSVFLLFQPFSGFSCGSYLVPLCNRWDNHLNWSLMIMAYFFISSCSSCDSQAPPLLEILQCSGQWWAVVCVYSTSSC